MTKQNKTQVVTIGPRRLAILLAGRTAGGAGVPRKKIPKSGELPVLARDPKSGQTVPAICKWGGKSSYLVPAS